MYKKLVVFFVLILFLTKHSDAHDMQVIEMSLTQALYYALLNNQEINLAKETALFENRGKLQKESGVFDTYFILKTQSDFVQEELNPLLIKDEKDKRKDIRQNIYQIQRNREKNNMLSSYLKCLSSCTPHLNDCDNCNIMSFQQIDNSLLTNEDILELYDQQNAFKDANDFYLTWFSISPLPDEKVEKEILRQNFLFKNQDQISKEIEALDIESKELSDFLAKLGDTPETEQSLNLNMNMSLSKKFRMGFDASLGFEISHESWQYKHHDQVEPPLYKSIFNLSILLPLGKHRGVISSGASEKQAIYNYEAGLHSLRHIVSQNIYYSIVDYWDLVVAQDTVRIYNEYSNTKNKIKELIQRSKNKKISSTDEKVRDAYFNEIETKQLQAEINKHKQTQKISQTLGLKSTDSHCVSATTKFSKINNEEEINEFEKNVKKNFQKIINMALIRRKDYSALQLQIEAEKAIYLQAKNDIKPKADLQLILSYSGTAIDSNAWAGIPGVSIKDLTGPSLSAIFEMEIPYQNSISIGNLQVAEANYNKKKIAAKHLIKTIHSRVNQSILTLINAYKQLSHTIKAENHYTFVINKYKSALKDGIKITIIDFFYILNQLIDLRINMLLSNATYLKSLAKFLHETGLLIIIRKDGYEINYQYLIKIPDDDFFINLMNNK